MNRSRNITKQNFAMGMRKDAALTQDPQIYLRSLKNYKIDYVDGALEVRKGYTRWNTTVLADYAYQLYHFVDMSWNEHLLAVIGTSLAGRWYVLSEAGSHSIIIDETTVSPNSGGYRKPIVTWNNRCFLGTNYGWYWTDNTALGAATKYYQAGIDPPDYPIQVESSTGIGNLSPSLTPPVGMTQAASCYRLNNSTQGKIAASFTLTQSMMLGAVTLSQVQWVYDSSKSGSVRIRIETNSGSNPSGTLVDANAISDWYRVVGISGEAGDISAVSFKFLKSVVLAAGTYWVVLESNDSYKNNYNDTSFFLALGYNNNANGRNYALVSTTWSVSAKNIGFFMGDLVEGKYFDYCYTLYNSTYGIESRPASPSRILAGEGSPSIKITTPTISDTQVDKVRVYRREIPKALGADALDEEITDEYKLVGEYATTTTIIYDAASMDYLGGIIQSLDHYRIGEADDTEQNRRGVILPAVATVWKGRIWVVPDSSNMLYYSKKLEEDGALGVTGDMIPDYFPPDNQIQMPTMEAILRLEPLTGDQLAIYCKNGSIWLMWGCDSVLNPFPVEDYIIKEMIPTTGLVASAGLGNFRGKHVFLSRKGIYGFSGSPDLEFLSENIQSIIDDITDTYLTTSVVMVFGDELWFLVDDDNDGAMENIYIFDLQKSTPAWRYYNYGVNINDIIQRQKGTSYKTLFAADATNKYILELEDGTTDNSQAIESEIETHNIKVDDRVMVHDIEINGNYPGTPPSYEANIIDNTEELHSYWLSPESETDTRGNKTGTRVISVDTIRLKLTSWSLVANELRKIRIGYVEK